MPFRFYFDTSVFGGVFDKEFMEETRLLFEQVKLGRVICVYSNLTESELVLAPDQVKEFFSDLNPEFVEKIQVSPEAFALAQTYIDENVVGPTSLSDCIHIATATLNNVDILISWNFKHIVNVTRIKGYNSVNLQLGHQTLEIRSPKNMHDYENEG